jgi:hypothetical protein
MHSEEIQFFQDAVRRLKIPKFTLNSGSLFTTSDFRYAVRPG